MSCSSCSVEGVSDAQQGSFRSQIQIAVLAKGLAAQKQAGKAVVELLQQAVELSQEAGKGSAFDGSA